MKTGEKADNAPGQLAPSAAAMAGMRSNRGERAQEQAAQEGPAAAGEGSGGQGRWGGLSRGMVRPGVL